MILQSNRGDIGIGIVLMLLIVSVFAFYVSGMTRTIRNQDSAVSASIMRNKAEKSVYVIADRLAMQSQKQASTSTAMFIPSNRMSGWLKKFCMHFGGKDGLFIPPKDSGGMPRFLKPIVGKDPWGNDVAYYSWDLRTQTPPKPGMVVRFVSPGADGKIETTKKDAWCKGDDICVDITEQRIASAYNKMLAKKGTLHYGTLHGNKHKKNG